VLRSVLMANETQIMKPGTFLALAVVAGCAIYMALTLNGWMGATNAAWVTIAAVFLIRLASVVYDIKTEALTDFEDEWKGAK
jgi:hypothetical protein